MLTPEEQAALVVHVNTKWRSQLCPLCGDNKWNVTGWISMLVSDQLGVVLGSPLMPMIALGCDNCGNTIMINAMVAGILPAHRSAPEAAQKPAGGSGV